MPMIRAIAIGLVALLPMATNAAGEDLEFGADSLPYLADGADLVVRVSDARREKSRRASLSAYRAVVREVIRGETKPGAQVGIVVPRGFDVEKPEALTRGVLFLRRVEKVELPDLGVDPRGAPLYWLVSGNHGAVGSDTGREVRTDQVREYVALQDRNARLEWAERQVGAGDPYLQRSALFELAQPEYADEPKAVQILGDAATSSAVSDSNRGTAIQLLEKSESPQALSALREVVVDPKASPYLRKTAVQAMPGLPGGQAMVQELAVSGAPEIQPFVQEVLGEFTPQTPPSRNLKEIQGMLRSPQRPEREQGFQQLRVATPSPETVRMLGDVIAQGTPGGTSDKLRAVEALGAQRNRPAIERLAVVAKDRRQPEVVRSQAILEIAKQPTGLRIGVMEDLEENLESGLLQDLATGLK